MRLFSKLTRRFRGRLYREPAANLGDEVRFHLEMEAQALERAGLSPEAARAEAHRKFGGVDRYTEELRDERGGSIVESIGKDARYAFRLARRFPAFTSIVLLTLGVAIGANTAIFSVVDTVLLRPLPFPHGEDLVLLYGQNPDKSLPRFSVSYADYLDWQKQTRSFTDMPRHIVVADLRKWGRRAAPRGPQRHEQLLRRARRTSARRAPLSHEGAARRNGQRDRAHARLLAETTGQRLDDRWSPDKNRDIHAYGDRHPAARLRP
jgi:hypothetical protein